MPISYTAGGDVDGASKTLLGVSTHPPLFLIAVSYSNYNYYCLNCFFDLRLYFLLHAQDPHYVGPSDKACVIASGFIKWHGPELFQTSSFYNFCLPLSIIND